MPALSLIVSVYRDVDFLDLILKALMRQRFTDFEVIVSEDGESAEMQQTVAAMKTKVPFSITHLQQPDEGFRKNRALNRAMQTAASDYLVFLDGDCLPHPAFLFEHARHRQPGTALFGRRVMLSEQHTAELTQKQQYGPFSFFELWRKGAQRLDCALYLPFTQPAKRPASKGIWGCNWSIHKTDIMAVNGFDEDYTTAGIGEDVDIEWRLRANGTQLRYIKWLAVQYHLHHPVHYSSTAANEALCLKKQQQNVLFCKNGIQKWND